MAPEDASMTTTLKVALADDERDIRDYLKEAVQRMGYEVTTAVASGHGLVAACRANPPDLVITDILLPDIDGIEAARQINSAGPIPVVLISAHHNDELLARVGELPVMGYLVKPFGEANLKAALAVALARYRQLAALAGEASSLRQALEDRKVIERAKGALMRRLGVDEDEAFRRLRKAASSRNMKLVEMAKQIIAAETVFADLSG